jgi:hypothetical protein
VARASPAADGNRLAHVAAVKVVVLAATATSETESDRKNE